MRRLFSLVVVGVLGCVAAPRPLPDAPARVAPERSTQVLAEEGVSAFQGGRWEEARAAFAEVASRRRDDPAVLFDLGLVAERQGRPAEAILTAVADHEIDLIVIATHTRHGRIRFSPTSVAGHILQNSGTPVLVVRGVDDADHTDESTLPDVEQSESEEDNYFDDFLFV